MQRAILCAALGASMFVGVATAAWAENGQMRVELGDLNMATRDGAKEALHRIEFQAGGFCDANTGRQPLERTDMVNHCVADMTRKSVDQLHAPMVTALLRHEAPQAQPGTSVTLATLK